MKTLSALFSSIRNAIGPKTDGKKERQNMSDFVADVYTIFPAIRSSTKKGLKPPGPFAVLEGARTGQGNYCIFDRKGELALIGIVNFLKTHGSNSLLLNGLDIHENGILKFRELPSAPKEWGAYVCRLSKIVAHLKKKYEYTTEALMPFIKGLTSRWSVTDIDLAKQQIGDCSLLESLSSLESIDMSDTRVHVLDCAKLGKLKHLKISDSSLARLDNIEGLKCLETLDLSANKDFYFRQKGLLFEGDEHKPKKFHLPLGSHESLKELNLVGTKGIKISYAGLYSAFPNANLIK